MSDLYTVLKQSIIERNLRSAIARQEVYGQARTAMIRQLWTYDPPLSQTEIDERIGHFDTAVQRIENDLVRTFSEAPAGAGKAAKKRPADPPVPVYEGYDEAGDYAPVVSRRTPPPEPPRRADRALSGRSGTPPGPSVEPDYAPGVDEIEEALTHRSAEIEDALRSDREAPDADFPGGDADRRLAERFRPGVWSEDDAREEEEHSEDYGYQTREEPGHDALEPRDDDSEEPEERPRRRPGPRIPLSGWGDLSERGRIAILLSAIATLAVVLIVLALVFLLPSDPTTTAGGAVPPAGDPAATGGGQRVVESFVLFDGRDPTVFESASGNPIRFEGDTSGGFARVSSSAADAGVRVTIGPGLANRLAGRTIRLMLVARSARENGAVGLRFAYQSGVAFSHWQGANLSPDYVALALTWRVPKQRTDATGDHILIEPGIPGDGTGADVRSIKIDVLG